MIDEYVVSIHQFIDHRVTSGGALLHFGSQKRLRKRYLLKVPQWMSETISESAPGTEIGYSYPIAGAMSTPPSTEEVRLVVTAEAMNGAGKPAEYGMSLPNTSQNLWVFQGDDTSKDVFRASGTAHMIPKRDQKYSAVLKERLSRSDLSVQHRTQHDETSHDSLRGAVHLFQRPSTEEAERSKSIPLLAGSPDSQASSSRVSKRMKALDEMPQQESRQAAFPPVANLDDALMHILVNRDTGWPLQQLSKAVKETGVSVPMAQLKSKLLEICVYQRRGEDTHPKYYLKSEYK
jgi:hypothetical protein